jgi:hypothetical protein
MAFALSPDEVARIRATEIAKGNFPEVLETAEAALLVRRSEEFLERSDAPRSYPKGSGEGARKRPVWLKSQLLAWLKNHLTYDAEKPLKRAM